MDEKVLETIRTANGKDPIAEVEAHLESIAKANTSHERFRAKYDAEKQRLFKALLPLAAGRSMTYEELKKIIDMNPQRHPGYKIVRDVCKKLLKEHRQVWKPVTRFGLVRQTDEQVIDGSHKVLKSVHKKVRRSGDRVSSVEYDKLDETRKDGMRYSHDYRYRLKQRLVKKGDRRYPEQGSGDAKTAGKWRSICSMVFAISQSVAR